MDKEKFETWKDSETTREFREYLKDSAIQEVEILSDAIASGAIISETEQTRTSAIIMTLRRILDIDFEEIEDFYNERK